jgi:hypothetical protein
MTICDRTFELVEEQLAALEYKGPVGLSCDDSKLFPAWRLYYDFKRKSHFVVGGSGEPMQVANPDQLKEIIDDAKITQAKKVSNWILT